MLPAMAGGYFEGVLRATEPPTRKRTGKGHREGRIVPVEGCEGIRGGELKVGQVRSVRGVVKKNRKPSRDLEKGEKEKGAHHRNL